MTSQIPFRKLPGKRSPILRLNTICPYFTMFPLDFPFNNLKEASPGDWVLDPFCGRGTTNFAARLLGLPSVGVDSNPVASAIAKAKFINIGPESVISLCKEILHSTKLPVQIPTGEFWELCYNEKTLIDICKIREYLIRHCNTEAEIALRAIMLGILHGPRQNGRPTYLSNQMPRTYATKPNAAVRFWKKRNLFPQYVNVLETVTHRSNYSLVQLPPPCPGEVYERDSRFFDIPTNKNLFRWVVTSPPYLGMKTYYSDQWLRNWFLGGPDRIVYSTKNQISRNGENNFVKDLARVWRNVAKVCTPGAKMIIRFGALPSLPKNPVEVLIKSLKLAECGWTLVKINNAGTGPRARRQAVQFIKKIKPSIDEFDFYTVFNS